VVPLLFEATLEGFIALGERINPDEEMSYEDYDLMRVLARQATSSILNLRLSRQLSTAQELAAIGKISAFIIHDLKNQVSGLSLLVDNARNYMDDPEFQQDMLETVENTVGEMNALIHKLRDLREHPGQPFVESDLMQLVEESVENLAGNVKLYGKRITAKVDAEGIRKVVLNLILNAFEASAEGTPVEIEIGEQGQAFIRVTDRGCGMSQEFVRTRLFRPFETTKKKGSGIGLYQCRQIVAAHGGRIDVESTSGAGSSFTVYLSG
jgi:putative PEP-CTERM system histidine kinase